MNKTKRVIFEAAIKVFSIYGYDGATMNEVASNAGVAKGTLYYHFKSKEELFKYIIKEGTNVMSERLEEVSKKQDNSIDKLKQLCKIQISMVYENRDFFKVVMSQLWGQELRQLELRESIQKYINNIENYLEDAVRDGFVKEGNMSFMAYTIFGILCSAAIYELINKDENNINEVVDNFINYLLTGIAKKQSNEVIYKGIL